MPLSGGYTNFLQHNPSAANQEDDTTYNADSTRTGGIGVDQIMPSPWMNKIWYQCTTFVAAMARALANKGYGVSDADINVLTTVLGNIVTNEDLKTPLLSVPYSPTPTFDASTTNGFELDLAADVTSSTLINTSIGQTLTFVITQPGGLRFTPPPNINGWQPIDMSSSSTTVQQFIVREDGTIWPISRTRSLTPHDLTYLRALNGGPYNNDKGYDIDVMVTASCPSHQGGTMYVNLGPDLGSMTQYGTQGILNAGASPLSGSTTFRVPAGWFYQVTYDVNLSLSKWTEWTQ